MPGVLVIIGVAVLFPVMFVPHDAVLVLAPRMALLIATLPAGVVTLAALMVRRSRSATIACGLLAWCLVAASFSGDVRGAIVGVAGRELSLIIVVGSIGLWALGRQLSDRVARFLRSP